MRAIWIGGILSKSLNGRYRVRYQFVAMKFFWENGEIHIQNELYDQRDFSCSEFSGADHAVRCRNGSRAESICALRKENGSLSA
jgi:hypothetical protein